MSFLIENELQQIVCEAYVFAEGLIVAAWVSLWESLAIFMVEWFPLRKNTKLYRLLAEAELIFVAKQDATLNTGELN